MKKVLSVMIITLCLFFVGMTGVSAKEYLKRNEDVYNYIKDESIGTIDQNAINILTSRNLTVDDMYNYLEQSFPKIIEPIGYNYSLKKVCEAFPEQGSLGDVCGRDSGRSEDMYTAFVGITKEEYDAILFLFNVELRHSKGLALTQEEINKGSELYNTFFNTKKDEWIARITNAPKNTIKKEGIINYPELGDYKYAMYVYYYEGDSIYLETLREGIPYSLVVEEDPKPVVVNPKTIDMNIPLMIFGTVALIGISAVSYRKLKKTN